MFKYVLGIFLGVAATQSLMADDLFDDGNRYKLTCAGRSIASDGAATEFELVSTDAKNAYVVDGKICRSSRMISSNSTTHPTCKEGRYEVDKNHGSDIDRCYVNHLRTINPECPDGSTFTAMPGKDVCIVANFVYKQPGVVRPKKVVKYQYVYEDQAASRGIASQDELEE